MFVMTLGRDDLKRSRVLQAFWLPDQSGETDEIAKELLRKSGGG